MRIFLNDRDYRHFVYLLSDVVERFDIECWNYCLMPNHYHLTVMPNLPNISEAVRRLNSIYALWWNRQHKQVGHVFQGRFKAQIVQEDGYLTTLCRYVALNPVRARLVTHPEEWKWSSYAATVGPQSPPAFLTLGPTLRRFGSDDDPRLRQRFREFVTRRGEIPICDDRFRSSEGVIGDKPFKASVRAKR